MARLILGGLALFVVMHAAAAQAPAALPPIDTDRPDFTDGTGTLVHGHIQLESGFTRTVGVDRLATTTAPELLLRLGVLHWAELRVSATWQSSEISGAAIEQGVSDVTVGTKFHLTAQHGAMPALSGEAFASLPTGADAVSAHVVLPGAALLLGWQGDSPWSAGVEFQVAQPDNQTTTGIASLSVQYQATSRLQPYVEYYTVQALRGAGAEQYLNSGLLWMLTDNLQLDGRIGAGLTTSSSRSFVGFGFAIRR